MSSNGALHGADTWVSLVLSPCWPDIIPAWHPNVVSSLRICTTWENKTQALWPFGLITVSRGNKYLNWKRMIDHIGAIVPVMFIRLCVAFGICGTGQQGVLSRLLGCKPVLTAISATSVSPAHAAPKTVYTWFGASVA